MTSIFDLVFPLASMGGIAALIWGAATIVKGSKDADDVQAGKIKRHDLECTQERKDNRDAIADLRVAVAELSTGKRDK